MQPVKWQYLSAQSLLDQMDQVFEEQLLLIQDRLPELRKLCLRGAATPKELAQLAEIVDTLDAAEGGLSPALKGLCDRARHVLQTTRESNPTLFRSLNIQSPALETC